jgi:hypothetical protein
MSDETTNGVLLKGADGANYFIPHTDLAQFAVPDSLESGERAAAAQSLDCFAVVGEPADSDDGDSTAVIIFGLEGEAAEIFGIFGVE